MRSDLFKRAIVFFLLFTLSGLIASCATVMSKYAHGGRVVENTYAPEKILVSYEPDNKESSTGKLFLILDNGKLAILEENDDGMDVVIDFNRTSDAGDHFVIWIKGAIMGAPGPAGEIIVPRDRSQPAQYYWYERGSYAIETINGITRPVPLRSEKPFTLLIPSLAP